MKCGRHVYSTRMKKLTRDPACAIAGRQAAGSLFVLARSFETRPDAVGPTPGCGAGYRPSL
jgi:hypothetical protein